MSDVTLNRFLASGTAAEMAAFTPTPPTVASGPDAGYFWYQTDTGDTYAWDGAAWQPVGGGAGGDALTTNPLSQFAATTSAQLAGVITDETGSGALVFGTSPTLTSPTLVTPALGTPSALVLTNATGLPLTTGVTGDLPLSNLAPAAAAATFLGRGSASAGDWQALTPGVGIAISGTTVNVTTGGNVAQSSFLVAGGQITWIEDFDFLISAATYYLNGVALASAETALTLDAADATFDRIDVIVVNDAGVATFVTGVAAANPSEPEIDPSTQLKLGIVLVDAGATEPTVNTELLYFENAGGPGEWNWAAVGSGFNVNSASNPKAPATKDIEGTAVTAGAYAEGTIPSGSYDPSDARLLILYIRSKAAWANNRGLTVTLRNGTVLVGQAVAINRTGSFGFESATTGSYQLVAIPVSLFAVAPGTTITRIRVAAFGSGHGFYLADLAFQEEGASQTTQYLTQAEADARYAPLGTGGGDALTTNPLSQFAATTSLQLKNTISDETGSGALVFATSPTLVTPILGTPTSGTLTNCTGLPATSVTGDLPLANLAPSAAASKLLGRGDSGAGDWEPITLGTGLAITGTTIAATGGGGDALTSGTLAQFAATTSLQLKNTISDETGSGALVFANTPTLVTPALGAATATSLVASGTVTGSNLSGTNTGDQTSVTGNAGTATALQTPRTINGVSFDGTTNITIPRTALITATIDGAGSVITTGVKGPVSVPVACTITGVRLLSADAATTSGSIVVDIWKDSYTNFPPVVGDTITAAAKPTISAGIKSEDTVLTGWSTALAAGDVLMFNVDSVTTLTRVTVGLTVTVP